MTLKEIFEKAVGDALRKHDGNRVRAAKELGVSVGSIRNWVKKNNKGYRFGKIPPMRLGTPKVRQLTKENLSGARKRR